jgi:WS/DGAT/MGAT family acyltransferase
VALRRLRTDELLYLAVGDRNTPMQIALLGVFDGGPFLTGGRLDVEGIRTQLALRCRRVPEFRQRVLRTRPGEGRPLWVPDPEFDPRRHVRTARMPSGAELPGWAADRAARALEPDRPPWRAEVIGGLPGGRFAVLIVISHVLADGLAGVALAGALLDAGPAVAVPEEPLAPPPPLPSHRELLRLRLRELAAGRHRGNRRPGGARVRAGLRQIRETLAGFGGPEPLTPLPRRIGPGRRMVVIRHPLGELESAGHVLGGTVNDVLLTAVAGGLRAHLAASGPVPPQLVLRAMVPVATARDGRQVSAVLVVGLPVGLPDPVRRLSAIHGLTAAGKARLHASGGDAIDLPLPFTVGRWVVRASRRYGSSRMTLAVTDVPGPREPLWLAGARLVSAVPIAPMSPLVPLSVAALSYAGELVVSVNADVAASGLDVLAAGIAGDFSELAERAGTAMPVRPGLDRPRQPAP